MKGANLPLSLDVFLYVRHHALWCILRFLEGKTFFFINSQHKHPMRVGGICGNKIRLMQSL